MQRRLRISMLSHRTCSAARGTTSIDHHLQAEVGARRHSTRTRNCVSKAEQATGPDEATSLQACQPAWRCRGLCQTMFTVADCYAVSRPRAARWLGGDGIRGRNADSVSSFEAQKLSLHQMPSPDSASAATSAAAAIMPFRSELFCGDDDRSARHPETL